MPDVRTWRRDATTTTLFEVYEPGQQDYCYSITGDIETARRDARETGGHIVRAEYIRLKEHAR